MAIAAEGEEVAFEADASVVESSENCVYLAARALIHVDARAGVACLVARSEETVAGRVHGVSLVTHAGAVLLSGRVWLAGRAASGERVRAL